MARRPICSLTIVAMTSAYIDERTHRGNLQQQTWRDNLQAGRPREVWTDRHGDARTWHGPPDVPGQRQQLRPASRPLPGLHLPSDVVRKAAMRTTGFDPATAPVFPSIGLSLHVDCVVCGA